MRMGVVTAAVGAAAVLWVGLSAQQEVLPRPGPGSGVTRVAGSIEVTNAPEVHAAQRGAWQVGINNVPTVRVAEIGGPAFLQQGQRYELTWADGQVEAVTVTAAGRDGWIEVDSERRRWINLSSVRAIQRAR